MILTGDEIAAEVKSKRIVIDPFDKECLNPNSYNYHLGTMLKVRDRRVTSPYDSIDFVDIALEDSGTVLEPAKFYLGHTEERIGSDHYVTSLIGRSSVGRLGLFLQLSADLGHQGAIHRWTLELFAVQPIRVYPGMQIGQVSFWVPVGDASEYRGAYAEASLPLEHRPGAFI